MKTRLWHRGWWFFLPAFIGIAVFVNSFFLQRPLEKKENFEIKKNVRTFVVQPVDITPKITGSGRAYPDFVWNCLSQVTGVVEYIHPKLAVGNTLDKDTVILRIDPSEYKIALQSARANLQSVESQIQELAISQKNQKDLLKIEKETLRWYERELERQKKLLRNKTSADADYEKQLRATLSQRYRVQSLENNLRLIPSQQESLLASKQQAISKVEDSERLLAKTIIRLPEILMIADVSVAKSQYITHGQKLVRGEGIQTMEVEGKFWQRFRSPSSITGTDKATNRKQFFADAKATVRWYGKEQTISWPADFVRFTGHVETATRSIGLVFAVSNPYNVLENHLPLLKGMYCEVELRGKSWQQRIVVPPSVVHDNKIKVVDSESRLRKKAVEILWEQENFLVIRGVEAGEEIVVSRVIPDMEGILLEPLRDLAVEKVVYSSVADFEGVGQ